MVDKPKRGQTLDLPIETLAFGGKGLAKPDGFVIFVPGAVPQDLVRVTVTKTKKRYAEARLEEILEPSPYRREARCCHFGACGGCRWQNLDYGVQLEYKARLVRESLEHLGGLSDFELAPIVRMDHPWRYRNKVEFSIGAGASGEAVVGFHPPGRWDQVLPLTECHLVPESTESVRAIVEQWIRESRLPPWDPVKHEGLVRHLTVRQAHATGEMLVSLVTSTVDLPNTQGLVEELLRSEPQVVGVLHAVNSSPAEVATGHSHEVLWGRPFLFEELDHLRLEISIDAFFQTNTCMARPLYRIAAAEAALRPDDVLWDLYSGIGSIALYMAPKVRFALGVEVGEAAIRNARKNARLNAADNVEFIQGDARVVLKEILEGRSESLPGEAATPDVIVLDPPRSGLAKKVVARTAASAPDRIVYISCNPTTMAPNVAQFHELGYRLRRVTPVDMFPHTPHIEAVGLLERTGSQKAAEK